MKITINSDIDVFYYSFYIEGFYRILGKENVSFSRGVFPKFSARVLAGEISQGEKKYRLIIDALDTSSIFIDALEWCQVYGKVNYNSEVLPGLFKERIQPIGPSFGIRLWSLWKTIFFALSNYTKSKELIVNKKYFFTSYWRQYKRPRIENYCSRPKRRENYVFFLSSLWRNENRTNSSRALFIRICKSMDEINFEGGFAPRSDNEDLGFSDLITKRINPGQYLKKIKDSSVVFNTPAVQDCFGWKLAEFLALGKAVISTNNINELPAPLKHGEDIHYLSSSKMEMKDSVKKIMADIGYREKLEHNALKYFRDYLAPEKVTRILIGLTVSQSE